MWWMRGQPRTIPKAVALLKRKIPADTLHLIRGAESFDPAEFHFDLSMWVRDELGLWNEGSRLLRACNTNCADNASGIILIALREDLVRMATPEEMARSREVRRAYARNVPAPNRDRWTPSPQRTRRSPVSAVRSVTSPVRVTARPASIVVGRSRDHD
jgi:hypothetical protein